MSAPEHQSYLTAGINKISPWGSRSPASKPVQSSEGDITNLKLKQPRGGDHRISHRRGLSLKNYPRDCPPLLVQWFHAVDIPKRKPIIGGAAPSKVEKARGTPKKYAAFSKNDSRALEAAFQKLDANSDAPERRLYVRDNDGELGQTRPLEFETPTSSIEEDNGATSGTIKVPVNEDFLFDVDIELRELGPAYWLGPIYDVRRGTWFQDGNIPCDENLATQLEEGFLKTAAWRTPQQRSASQPRTRTSSIGDQEPSSNLQSPPPSAIMPKTSSPDLRKDALDPKSARPPEPTQHNTYRLFGPYSNSIVTYQDATTAWVLTDDLYSRLSGSVYQRFAGGSHLAGMKVARGYVRPIKKSDNKDGKRSRASSQERHDSQVDANVKVDPPTSEQEQPPQESPTSPSLRQSLERHMSSLVTSTAPEDPEQQEEEVRKRDEKEIEHDYQDQEGDEQNREIEHLVLVTHGIGQRLGLRMETVNFIHDVNTFRKTLKAVYSHSADLQALNAEVDAMPKNCRVQVLPINWRHKLDFPKQSLKHNRGEHDLGDAGFGEEEDYPNLDDLTVEGVPAVRNLITDLALDILLYDSPAYKDHIARIVVEECNRTYSLFRQRQPEFKGKVSFVGHSLGSAIMFDILCRQSDETRSRKGSLRQGKRDEHKYSLDFEVEDFYAMGSPIGLFQMLKGRRIAARQPAIVRKAAKSKAIADPFLDEAVAASTKLGGAANLTSDIPISAPKCHQIYNIFHPTDPISYRIEPLISPLMSTMKPQPLPYTKRGLFGVQAQGLTGIGTRVGQSVSGLWSSFSSGIASSLLNRSLGISAEDETKLRNQANASSQSRLSMSSGAGTNIAAGTIPGPVAENPDRVEPVTEDARQKLAQDAIRAGEEGDHPPTLIDSNLETLYAGFQRRRKSLQSDGSRDVGEYAEWEEAEERAKKLKKEEAKVRALNANGRVDYSIQE